MIFDEREAPKLMLVTDVVFWNRERGSSQRIQTLFEHLTTYCQVTVCFVGELSIGEWHHAEKQLSCELIGPGKPGRLATVLVGQVSRLKFHPTPRLTTQESRQAMTLSDFQSDAISQFVRQEVEKRQTDAVLLEYLTLGYLCDGLKTLADPPLMIIDTHDLMYARCAAFESSGLQHWLQISRDEEIAMLDKADVVLAIQEQEAAALRTQLSNAKVCLAKHAITARDKNISSTSSRHPDFLVGFVGSRGLANLYSLAEFLRHCWPEIRSRCEHHVRLKIGGDLAVDQLDIADLDEMHVDGVDFTGRFGEPHEFYADIDLAINPAQIDSGMKVKSLEALANSVPLVSTPAGIAGLEGSVGICALAGDDWQTFSSHVHSLWTDRTRLTELSRNCLGFLANEFNPELVFADLKQLILETRR